MSIKYTVNKKKNLLRMESTGNRHAIAQGTGNATFKSSGKEISCRYTFTTADTSAVSVGLTQVLSEHSARVYIVHIGDLRPFLHRHRRRRSDKRKIVPPGNDQNQERIVSSGQ